MKIPGVFVSLLLAMAVSSSSAEDAQPIKQDLQLVYVFDGSKTEYIFVIGQSGFRSLADLKEYLKTWAPGSELRWAPGCERFGDEPLLSSEEEMSRFRSFLAERGITFVLVPSG